MIEKFNKYVNLSIIISLLLIILGIIILVFPTISLKIFSYIISVITILSGILLLIEDYKYRNYFFPIDFSFSGIIILLIGIILLIYPNTLALLIPIFLGVWIITSSIVKFKIIILLSKIDSKIWILSLIMTILSIVCGIFLILNPLDSAEMIISVIGILLIIYSISDISNMIIFKKNINKIVKNNRIITIKL